MITKEQMPNVFLDVETWAGTNKPSREDVIVPSNYKNQDVIDKYIDEHLDTQWRKQALNSLKGQIICIGYAINDGDAQVLFDTSEEQLMMLFDDVISKYPYGILVGHNLLRFDIPWLYHRSIKYKLPSLKSILPHGKRDTDMINDTMSLFSSTIYGSDGYYSLDEIAKFLGLNPKESSGADIHDMFVAKDYDKIKEHCRYDVLLTRQVYKLITE